MSATSVKWRHWVIALLALLGAGIMVYLNSLHGAQGESAFCDFSSELSCSVVNKSLYAEIAGIPVSLLGLVYFLVVPLLLFWKKIQHRFTALFLFTLFSLVFSLYLSGIEYGVLKSVCLFCELSKVVMLAILLLLIPDLKKEKIPRSWIVGTIVVAALFSWGAYVLQTGPKTVTNAYTIAACLQEKEVVMYGAYWCPSCAKQKKKFGAAFQLIDEVECDPRGENPETERCVARNIQKTPTWIQEQDGQEIKRLEGAHSLEELSKEFECE